MPWILPHWWKIIFKFSVEVEVVPTKVIVVPLTTTLSDAPVEWGLTAAD